MRRAFALCLCVALVAFDAGAATLYRWVDPDGREAIGTTPPPGVHAELYMPGAPPPPAAPAPAADAAAAPAAPAPTGGAAARAADEKRERCARLQSRTDTARAAIRKKEAEVEALEAKLTSLQQSEVAYSRVDCRNDVYKGDQHCDTRIFDRDKEIEKTETSLEAARGALDDLELRASGPPADCDGAGR